MKLFTLTAVLFLVAALGSAQPYLTCDPYPASGAQPDDFVIVLDGNTYYSAAVVDANGLRILLFDLAGLWQPGQNSTIVWARNVWGESAQVPFDFNAGLPTGPQNFRVVGSSP